MQGKLWSSVLDRDCGQAVCRRKGKDAEWESCPRPATEQQIEELKKTMKTDILAALKRVEDKMDEVCGHHTPAWEATVAGKRRSTVKISIYQYYSMP